MYDGVAIVTGIINSIPTLYYNRSQAYAISKNTRSYVRHVLGSDDGGQATTTIESRYSNARHRIWDDERSQTAAMHESIVSNANHGVGDCDKGQAAATQEGMVSDASHGLWDYSIFTTFYQFVNSSHYYGIAIVTGIINSITPFHYNGGQTTAIMKSIVSDARH
jgi:hypothetical protein